MNNVSENLVQAMEIIAAKKISELKFDITVQATIESLVNIDTGEYKVRYNGNIFSAFANDLTYTYKVGDNVFLKIPEGNFSGKKFIENKVNNKSISEIDLTNLENSISYVGPSWEHFYGYDPANTYGVCAGLEEDTEDANAHKIIFQHTNQSDEVFAQYATNYDLFKIQADFKTSFLKLHNKGNYGLKVTFFTNEVGSEVNYVLDTKNFNGDVYKFNNFSEQSIIVQTPKNYLHGLKSIELFQENFENIEENIVNNIFVKNIKIQYIEQRNLLDDTYHLEIRSLEGETFVSEDELTLEGRLIYNGQSLLSEKNSVCNWYEQDYSIVPGVDGYDKEAGIGWRRLNNNNFNILNVPVSQVPYEKTYKLVVTYNNSIVLAQEKTLYNYTAQQQYEYKLRQVTNADQIYLKINTNNANAAGEWYFSRPDNSYEHIGKGNEIEISQYLKYSYITFYCSIYDKNNNTFIVNRQLTVRNSESEEDVIISYAGDDIFRYNANGDLHALNTVVDKEHTLQCLLTWKEGFGSAYTLKWYMGTEDNEIGLNYENKSNPNNSMLEDLYIDNLNILHFKIKPKFKVNYNNNTLIAKITTLDKKEYVFKKELLFIKDGDQGTSGTTYFVLIRPCDNNGAKLSGFQPLLSTNILKLRAFVYKDGELIRGNKYYWNYENVIGNVYNADGAGDIVSITYDSNADNARYVKVQVNIQDNGKDISIYSLYPIDYYTGNLNNINKVDISNIPSYIQYTSSGTDPYFSDEPLSLLFNGEEIVKENNPISLNPNLLNIKTRKDNNGNNTYHLSPVTSFNFKEETIGILKFTIDNGIFYHPIVMYLNTYGNEAINGWDGTKLVIDEEHGQYMFAPQIGAGKKDSQNRFTGVVMGEDSGQSKVGLYGYQKGVNTFGLLENGTAYFGAEGKGRIQIDGQNSLIYGGTKPEAPNSMTMLLTTVGKEPSSTKAIQIKGSDGYSQATATAPTEGITYYFRVNSKQYAEGVFVLDATENVYKFNVNKYWVSSQEDKDFVDQHLIYNSNNKKYYFTEKEVEFYVKYNGYMYCNEGQIGGWTINSDSLSHGNVYFDTGGGISCDYITGCENTLKLDEGDDMAVIYLHSNGIDLRTPVGEINLSEDELEVRGIKPEKQYGIYARFG